MASGLQTEIELKKSVNPIAPLLITFDRIKKECKVETETNNEPITPYSGGEMCKPQDNLNSDVTGNMTETITHSTKKMKIDNHCKKRFTCSLCNKSVSRKSYLRYHLRIHSEANNPNKCDVCGTSFREKKSLSTHLMNHSGVKPYKCGLCDKGFTTNSSLSSHLNTHSSMKPYKCEECAKCFTSNSSLIRHILSHIDNNQYSCKTCGTSESCEDCLYFK